MSENVFTKNPIHSYTLPRDGYSGESALRLRQYEKRCERHMPTWESHLEGKI